MAAFLASVIVFALGVGVCALVGRARPIGTPVTWGEAFVAGPFVFALMLLAYGIIPHQWLKYADNDLLWRSDKIFVGLSMWHLKTGKAATHMAGAGRILINFHLHRHAGLPSAGVVEVAEAGPGQARAGAHLQVRPAGHPGGLT